MLARFAPNGVVIESSAIRFLGDEDEGTATAPMIVRAYLPVDERLEETRRKLEESLHYLGMIQPLPAPAFTPIADQNWLEAWKEHYRPIPVAKRLVIVPAWMDAPKSDRIAIRIDPGMAFGTGTHPTTQLCLELIEDCFINPSPVTPPPSPVIDVGCGSGILSIAALKLGAVRALGVDVDEGAIANARQNARLNGIGDELVLGVGSVREIREGRFAFMQAPLVIANILASVIIRLLGERLGELVTPGGTLILSGILQEQVDAVIAAAKAHGFMIGEQRQQGDWVALTMSK